LKIQILGVSADSVTKQEKFSSKHKFPFPLLSDENKEMLKAYNAWGLKKFMGREYMGIHRITYIVSKEGKVEHVFEKVKTKSHAKDVLEILF
jgi:peroxiredoxin Q/BCP